eukprot:g14790.t1
MAASVPPANANMLDGASFPGPNAALIGYTGYVGSNLAAQFPGYKGYYNTQNIGELANESYEVIVCAAAPGFKLGANSLKQDVDGNPYDDGAAMEKLIACLKTKVDKRNLKLFVLISTISVYAVTSVEESRKRDYEKMKREDLEEEGVELLPDGVDVHCFTEDRFVADRQGRLQRGGLSDSEYGRNRTKLENVVHAEFCKRSDRPPDIDYLIVRLPGIFGKNLRKNYFL